MHATVTLLRSRVRACQQSWHITTTRTFTGAREHTLSLTWDLYLGLFSSCHPRCSEHANPELATCAVASITFACYVFRPVAPIPLVNVDLQVKYKPYMSPADHPKVLPRLRELEEEGRELKHYQWVDSIVASVEAVEAKSRGATTRRVKWGADAEADAAAPQTAAQKAQAFVTNYNTVESVLLFSACLVCLSGIMLEVSASARRHSEVATC